MLGERYPEIAFLIAYGSADSSPFYPLDTEDALEAWRLRLDLEGVDILYVFGIGAGESYSLVKSWLKEKKERMLIFLDDDVRALGSGSSEEILTDSQVHLQLVSDSKELSETLKTLIETFPSHRVEVSALPVYAKKRERFFKKIRMSILRQSVVADALMTEALYSHELLVNIIANLKHWPHSFFANGLKGKFKNIPAIICGAGPSLQESIPLLKTLEDKALIIAGGSTIAALSNYGVVPHIGMALDPNFEEYSRLKASSAFEMPLVYGTRLHPDVFQTCNGPFGYIQSFTGGPCEAYFEREFNIEPDPIGPDLGAEALSITTLGLALAVEMGCNPIFLNGVDLAYTGMRRYAEGVMPTSIVFLSEMQKEKKAAERLLKRKGIQGTMIYTLVKWVMESSTISDYADNHPETEFINTSGQGLGFKSIKNQSLSEMIGTRCTQSWDLRGWIHAEIQELKMTACTTEKMQEKMDEVCLSLKQLDILAEQMLEELTLLRNEGSASKRSFPTGKITLLELDFEQEKAFECLFPQVGPAIDRLLNRSFGTGLDRSPEQLRETVIDRNIAKWEQLKKMIEKEISLFI